MAYRIESKEDIQTAVRRIGLEQIDRAIAYAEESDDVHKVVHDTRRRMKKMRSLLRLLRGEIGKPLYKDHNGFFRKLGRDLSDFRDAHVCRKTIDKLANRYKDALPDEFHEIRDQLHNRLRQTMPGNGLVQQAADQVLDRLSDAREIMRTLPVSLHCDFVCLISGLKREYRRGQDAFDEAVESSKREHFHTLRKRAKDHWHHLRLLRNLWPTLFKARAKEARRLSDMLGDDQDLMVLREELQGMRKISPERIEAIDDLISIESERLRQESLELSSRIYAESPDQFIDRMDTYWQTWREDFMPSPYKIMSSPQIEGSEI